MRREMEPGAEGDGAGCGRRMARGGRLDGPGRLRSKSFISANKGFFALKAKRRSRALRQAKRQRREGTYSLTHLLTSDI